MHTATGIPLDQQTITTIVGVLMVFMTVFLAALGGLLLGSRLMKPPRRSPDTLAAAINRLVDFLEEYAEEDEDVPLWSGRARLRSMPGGFGSMDDLFEMFQQGSNGKEGRPFPWSHSETEPRLAGWRRGTLAAIPRVTSPCGMMGCNACYRYVVVSAEGADLGNEYD